MWTKAWIKATEGKATSPMNAEQEEAALNAEQEEAARKVQSLLNLAGRPRGNDGKSNGVEAVAALEMAQELAAKHRLKVVVQAAVQ